MHCTLLAVLKRNFPLAALLFDLLVQINTVGHPFSSEPFPVTHQQ